VTDWYDHFAASLTGAAAVPDPLAPNNVADGRLVDAVAHDLRDTDGNAVAHDLRDTDGNATATAVRVIWTGDHLDSVRRLQEMLVPPARAALTANEPATGN
jgi:hypothetical protein